MRRKEKDGTAREMSYLIRNQILGFPSGSKYLQSEDWLEIIEKLIENSLPILKETICKKTIDELFFNRFLQRVDLGLDLNVETEDWEKFLGRQLVYLGVKFGVIGTAEIPQVKGDVFSQAQLVVDDSGRMYLFFVRLARVNKPKPRPDYATVREIYIISRTDDQARFRKSFGSLAANNPDFCQKIVRYGFDPVYLKLGKKEDEYKKLRKFKEIWERSVYH
ncbi:MAG TPA: hypothetical protein VMD74_02390 [Candidatus Methylomirabilis sp.]|nr:hypothetical protein [Candidatus Methylomirabilis sp.]